MLYALSQLRANQAVARAAGEGGDRLGIEQRRLVPSVGGARGAAAARDGGGALHRLQGVVSSTGASSWSRNGRSRAVLGRAAAAEGARNDDRPRPGGAPAADGARFKEDALMTPSRSPMGSRAGSSREDRRSPAARAPRRAPRRLIAGRPPLRSRGAAPASTARRPSRPPVGRRRARTRTLCCRGDAHRRLLRRQVGGAQRALPGRSVRRPRDVDPVRPRPRRRAARLRRAPPRATAPLSRYSSRPSHSSRSSRRRCTRSPSAPPAPRRSMRPPTSGPRYYVKSGAPSGAVSALVAGARTHDDGLPVWRRRRRRRRLRRRGRLAAAPPRAADLGVIVDPSPTLAPPGGRPARRRGCRSVSRSAG